MIDGRLRDQGQVGGGTAAGKVAAADMQIAGVVTALAVHQNQGVVWREAAQRRGQGQVGGVAAELLRREGGNRLAQGITQIGRAGTVGQRVGAQDRNGRGRVGSRHALHARTRHDDGFVTRIVLRQRGARPQQRSNGRAQKKRLFGVQPRRDAHSSP